MVLVFSTHQASITPVKFFCHISILATLALSVFSCGPRKPVEDHLPGDVAPTFVPMAGRAEPDDIARFLAGKPVRHGEMLSLLQQTADYRKHEAEMRGVWVALTRNRVRMMEDWSQSNIMPNTSRDRVLFYPFGGPDLLHAEALFGHIPTKILMGLEPVGLLPDLETLTPEQVLAVLPAYRNATRKQMQVSFFVTKEMKTDLDDSVLQGVTPIILATVALMDGTVESVNPLSAGPYQAVDVRYLNRYGLHCSAIYVRGDLSNDGFKNYRAFLDSYGRGPAYFKAASYLMHEDYFSQARADFLARSTSILQDDSGIPIRYFAPETWEVRCYGRYQDPIPLFSEYLQPDLRAAFQLWPDSRLPFGHGYQFRSAESNLMFAVRR
jgi:hypothetical protein